MKLKLIANPIAGGDALTRIEQARACLEGRGCRVELALTADRGDAQRAAAAAREEDFDRIVAAGGDGTLNEVINGLAPSAIPLAFLPLGTTNVFALEAGIPFNVEKACRLVLEGRPTPVCLGRAGETRFLLMAGIGFDAEVVRRVSTRVKRRFGKGAYLLSALDVLRRPAPTAIEVEGEDGTKRQGFGAILGNGRLYGGRFSVTPGASLVEPELEVCLFLRPGRRALLQSSLRVGLGRRLQPPLAEIFTARRLTVRGEGVAVQIDGDFHGELPMEFRAEAGELVMVLPQSYRR